MRIQNTPWGYAQQHGQFGTSGICWVSTAGHGGYYVPPGLYRQMPAPLRENPYGGGTWFEEDVEWALVVAAFPQYFEARDRYYAVKTIQGYSGPGSQYHNAFKWLTETEQGKALISANQFEPAESA